MQVKRETLHSRTPSKSSSDPYGPGYGWGSLGVRGCLGRRSSMLPTFQPAGHGRGQGKVMHTQKGSDQGSQPSTDSDRKAVSKKKKLALKRRARDQQRQHVAPGCLDIQWCAHSACPPS